MAGFFGRQASKIQKAATPQTGFWSSLGQMASRVGQGVLQYNLRKMDPAQPGTPPYLPPQMPPPSSQSALPLISTPPQTKSKKMANTTTIILIAGGALILFGGFLRK